nr:BTAD domain-containing putative transcriptional regulator [Kibdelosporangium sp. MJ126-NF4]CEL17806.1 transcriptional regulator, SARP family [Kibdelosporangium sp. MJ126-NF4]CTQ90970.1 transcriptional regulator, SARP family [Kibdelosporangium sp. MJ126-NF4]
MRFQILGPLAVYADDEVIKLVGLKQHRVLAALLLAAGGSVPLDQLVDAVWDDRPPATAEKQIRNTVSALRRVLAPTGVEIRPSGTGYRFEGDEKSIDAVVFTHRVRAARQHAAEQRASEAVAEFRAALSWWRGAALAGLASRSLGPQALRLDEERLSALEECIELQLSQGQHTKVVSELSEWVTTHPLRERLAALLMMAHYGSGSQAQALAVYENTRTALTEQIGLDPGPELRELRQRILNADPSLIPPSASPAAVAATRCDLPGDINNFTGRMTELRSLIGALPGTDDPHATTAVVITAVDGMAGVGKTSMAVHAAHQLVSRYPDAQLFIDLHAHTPGHQPLSPATALDRLLRAIGLPGERIPMSLDERSALWRAQLANRRALIVLDNAADTNQIRPLLPGTASCLAIVTSRNRLTSLESANLLSLDVLPADDGQDLFTRVVGDGRPLTEPEAVQDVLRLCGHLPLAIRIAASRLRHRPTWTTAHLASRLRDQQRRLSELHVERHSVNAAFALSYCHLTDEQQRVFRLLGLPPGQDIEPHAAAALTELDRHEAENLLEGLVDAHLLQQTSLGRYQLHDLLRLYARHLVTTTGPDGETALSRLFDHYIRMATAAVRTIAPDEKSVLPGYDQAFTWLETERPNLVAAALHSAEHGKAGYVCELSTTLWRYFHISGHHNDGLALHSRAAAAARTYGDPALLAEALANLGDICWWTGRYNQALTHFSEALELAVSAENRQVEGHSLHGLGLCTFWMARFEAALDYFQRSIDLARLSGNRVVEGHALHGLGGVHWRLGNYPLAQELFDQALQLGRVTDDRNVEGFALIGLGGTLARTGRYPLAADHFGQAVELARATDDRNVKGFALHGLATVYTRQQAYDPAVTHSRQALDVAVATGNRALESRALLALGDAERHINDHGPARSHHKHALELAYDIGDRALQAEVLNGQGESAYTTGEFEHATDSHQQAITLATSTGDRYELARGHDGLAHTQLAQGLRHEATTHWRKALDLYTAIDVPEAAGVKRRILTTDSLPRRRS